MADKPSQVHVEIFGQTYAVRAGTEPGYVEQLAAHVDAQMREVSRAGGAVDSLRIAVLAALNITDAYFQLRGRLEQSGSHLEKRAAALARELGNVLEE